MILTGSEIIKEVKKKNINIRPFNKHRVNPNSYNYRLGNKIKLFDHFDGEKSYFHEIIIPKSGMILKPYQMCLGHTYETIGSKKYAMSLIGRSSIGRLGLFIQISANLGHTTCAHRWTLELFASRSIKIYPKMTIGQVSFWTNKGKPMTYDGKYGFIIKVQESLND